MRISSPGSAPWAGVCSCGTPFLSAGGGAIISAASSGSAWLWNAGRAARLIHPVAAYPAEDSGRTEGEGEIPAAGEPDLERCAWALDVALDYVIPRFAPEVLVVHLSEPDSTQHHRGAAGAVHRQALEGVDRLFGAFRERFQAERDDWKETNLLLFSDHGVVTTAGMIDLEAELAEFPVKVKLGRWRTARARRFSMPNRKKRFWSLRSFCGRRTGRDRSSQKTGMEPRARCRRDALESGGLRRSPRAGFAHGLSVGRRVFTRAGAARARCPAGAIHRPTTREAAERTARAAPMSYAIS